MAWHQLSLQVTQPRIEPVEDQLLAIGAVSVTLRDAADQPLLEPKPGEMPTWDQSIIVGLFNEEADPLLLQAALSCELESAERDSLAYEFIGDKDWVRAWMDDFKPMQFGTKLWVVPSHLQPPEPEATNLVLDPGLAFGTGTHPTTALCLRWLDQQTLDGKRLLDFGCGSGILAIAGLLLGAEHAYVTDIDPQAIAATHSNATQNGVDRGIEEIDVQAQPTQAIDVLVANILAGPLLELAPHFAELCPAGCRLALSGILREQAADVLQRYSEWFDMAEPSFEEDWALVTGRRKA